MKKVIDVRRVYGRTVASAEKRRNTLVKQFQFEVLDELISDNLHIILTDLTAKQIKDITDHSMVLKIDNPPRLSI